MKKQRFLFSLLFTLILSGLEMFAQPTTNYNTDQGLGLSGYDATTYFSGKPQKGTEKYTTEIAGVKYKFVSAENLELFNKNPSKYLPQYGGWCAYAMGDNGEKVAVDPKTFEIRGGKLFLFYHSFFNNTLKKWTKNNPAKLKEQADKNWEKIIHK